MSINPIRELKSELKQLVIAIKTGNPYESPIITRHRSKYDHWIPASQAFRALHIADCELRGRPRSVIENPRENNEPREYLIEAIKTEFAEKFTAWRDEREALRSSQAGS